MAGSIPTLTASMAQLLQWVASYTDPLLGPFPANGQISLSVTFQNLLNAAFPANQCKVTEIVIAASGTSTTDLSAASQNVVLDLTATFARVMAAIIWLPTAAMHALGTAASAVVVGKAGTAPAQLFGLHDASSALRLGSGDARAWVSPNPAGYPIHLGKRNLQIVNSDAVNPANVLLGLIGMDVTYPQMDFSNPNNSDYFQTLMH